MTGERLVHAIDRVTQNHLCGVGPGLGTDAREPGMEITCSLCRLAMSMAGGEMTPTPRTWPENAWPTATELADWLSRCTSAERLEFVGQMLTTAQSVDRLQREAGRAKAVGLREAADDIVTDWAPVWGGPGMWFTTGNAVAELVADTLRSMASEIES